jgi:hypothetical protein
MEENYVFLMSAYNEIEAKNVAGILEIEGIKAKTVGGGREEFLNAHTGHESSTDIYVPGYAYDKAKQVVEVEMVRGDF